MNVKKEGGTSLTSPKGGNIPNMSDINGKQPIAGICQEWIDRVDATGAAAYDGSGTPCLVREFCSSL
jgi:hypothetical protein